MSIVADPSASPGVPGVPAARGPLLRLPDEHALRQVFELKYGPDERLGWGPRLRREYGYHNPDDWYEALLAGTCVPGLRWLDIGCGRELFPSNRPLAELLARRVGWLVGVDPDATLLENPYVHEKVQMPIDAYDGGGAFDLVTLRMVAEHIESPPDCVRAMARALAPGGLAVVYTVSGWSPIPLLTRLTPMALRHRIKGFLWRTDKRDTFPTCFRMNTRPRLRRLFAAVGLREEEFVRLDDCRTFSRFRRLQQLELQVRAICRALGFAYPEHCVVGVYRKP
jgi:SAM-dependent methyltransferase